MFSYTFASVDSKAIGLMRAAPDHERPGLGKAEATIWLAGPTRVFSQKRPQLIENEGNAVAKKPVEREKSVQTLENAAISEADSQEWQSPTGCSRRRCGG